LILPREVTGRGQPVREKSAAQLMSGVVERMGRLSVLLQVTVIPLCVSPFHQSPFVLPKRALAVWVALAMLLPLLLARALLRRDGKVWSEFDRPVALLGAWMVICSLFSLHLTASLDLLSLYLAAWITWKAAAVFIRSRRDRSLALGVFVLASLGCSLWVWKQAGGGVRFLTGTFGNPNLVSQYLLLPFGCLLPWVLRGRGGAAGSHRWFWIMSVSLLLLGVTLLRLSSLAALLGVLLAIITICVGFQMRGRWSLSLTRTQGTLLVLFFLLLSVGVGIQLFTREDTLKQTAEQVLTDQSVRVRLEVWKGSWELIKDNWLLGVGPGNFRLVYPLYRLESEMTVYSKATSVDHAHNCYIEWWAELGVIGLALMFWVAHRVTSKVMDLLTVAEGFHWYYGLGLLAALTATDGQSFFSSNIYQVGPVIGLGFLMGLLEATLRGPWTKEEEQAMREVLEPPETPALQPRAAVLLGLLAALGMNLALVPVLFQPSVADILLRSAIRSRNAGQGNRAAALFEESMEVDPRGYGAPYYRAVLALEQDQPEAAYQYAKRATRIDPNSYEALFIRAFALEQMKRTEEAKEDYRKVLRLFPPHTPAREGLRRMNETEGVKPVR